MFVLTLSFFGRVVERSEKPEYIYVGADRCVCPNGIRMGVSGVCQIYKYALLLLFLDGLLSF